MTRRSSCDKYPKPQVDGTKYDNDLRVKNLALITTLASRHYSVKSLLNMALVLMLTIWTFSFVPSTIGASAAIVSAFVYFPFRVSRKNLLQNKIRSLTHDSSPFPEVNAGMVRIASAARIVTGFNGRRSLCGPCSPSCLRTSNDGGVASGDDDSEEREFNKAESFLEGDDDSEDDLITQRLRRNAENGPKENDKMRNDN